MRSAMSSMHPSPPPNQPHTDSNWIMHGNTGVFGLRLLTCRMVDVWVHDLRLRGWLLLDFYCYRRSKAAYWWKRSFTNWGTRVQAHLSTSICPVEVSLSRTRNLYRLQGCWPPCWRGKMKRDFFFPTVINKEVPPRPDSENCSIAITC